MDKKDKKPFVSNLRSSLNLKRLISNGRDKRKSSKSKDKRKSPSLSPRGNIEGKRFSGKLYDVDMKMVVLNDNKTYFAFNTKYANLFRNLTKIKEEIFEKKMYKLNAICPILRDVSEKFGISLSPAEYVCFYAPYGIMFDLLRLLKEVDVIRITDIKKQMRYDDNNGNSLIILFLDCEEKSKIRTLTDTVANTAYNLLSPREEFDTERKSKREIELTTYSSFNSIVPLLRIGDEINNNTSYEETETSSLSEINVGTSSSENSYKNTINRKVFILKKEFPDPESDDSEFEAKKTALNFRVNQFMGEKAGELKKLELEKLELEKKNERFKKAELESEKGIVGKLLDIVSPKGMISPREKLAQILTPKEADVNPLASEKTAREKIVELLAPISKTEQEIIEAMREDIVIEVIETKEGKTNEILEGKLEDLGVQTNNSVCDEENPSPAERGFLRTKLKIAVEYVNKII